MEDTVQHKMTLGKSDTLLIQFDEYPGMQLNISYVEAVEAMLDGELRKIRSDRVATQQTQNYGLAASEGSLRQSVNRF